MKPRRDSEEEILRFQLIQLQRDKMVLLDQLAMIKVSVCFHCQQDLPAMEVSLQQTLERRSARLNKLREKVVRVSDDLRTEECFLHKTEEELLLLKKDSTKAARLLEQEQLRAQELKLAFEGVVREKRTIMAKKEIELERTQDLKAEIKQLQANNYACQVQSDLVSTREAVIEMQTELRHLGDVKDSLETELYTINEYLNLKRQELEQAKQSLGDVRKDETDLLKNNEAKLEAKQQMEDKLAQAEQELEHIKRQYQYMKDEKRAELDALTEERDAIEEIKRQVEMSGEDLMRLKAATSSTLQENVEAKLYLEEAQSELKRLNDRKMQVNQALAATKTDLEESQRLLQVCHEHQKESQEALSSVKNKMLADFTDSRKVLRSLQEERTRVGKEITKLNLQTLNKMGGQSSVDYQVKEVVDTLIGGITRVAPPDVLQPIVDHIKTIFSEYLRRHSIVGGAFGQDEEESTTPTMESCRSSFKTDDIPCSSLSSSRSSFRVDEASVSSLENELGRKTVAKEELRKRHDELEEELAKVKDLVADDKANILSEEEKSELESIKETMASIQEGINDFKKKQEALTTRLEKKAPFPEKYGSLHDIYQGAVEGIKDPYPDMRRKSQSSTKI